MDSEGGKYPCRRRAFEGEPQKKEQERKCWACDRGQGSHSQDSSSMDWAWRLECVTSANYHRHTTKFVKFGDENALATSITLRSRWTVRIIQPFYY